MIRYLEGTIRQKKNNQVLLVQNGLGFLVYVPFSTWMYLPQEGESVALFTFLEVKQDRFNLYGFLREEDCDFFEVLLNIPGVGPKVGLNLLGAYHAEELSDIIASHDVEKLGAIPGLGPKKATRLLVEVKPKMLQQLLKSHHAQQHISHIRSDVEMALSRMGLSKTEVQEALKKVDWNDVHLDFSKALRQSLQTVRTQALC